MSTKSKIGKLLSRLLASLGADDELQEQMEWLAKLDEDETFMAIRAWNGANRAELHDVAEEEYYRVPRELYFAFQRLGADAGLLGIIGSWRDGKDLTPEQVEQADAQFALDLAGSVKAYETASG